MATDRVDPVLTENEEVRRLKEGYKYGWHDKVNYAETPKKGLSHEVIDQISDRKDEPDWMRKFRHKALDYFFRRPMPSWGADLSDIDFYDIYYYIKPMDQVKTWEEMPEEIRNTWDKLGIPEAEKNYLGGVSVQYESESVYHSTKKELEDQGVIFTDMDTALREHPDLVKEYWATVIPPNDNKFSALNSAVWSGGSFIWVPSGVSVDIPLQAYFRINEENMGQFERTLIICEPGSWVHYVEGCLPAGELVSMASGERQPIETVKVGDLVFSEEGRPARVKAIQVRDHKGPMLTFRPVSPDNAFRVTPEHPLLIVRREEVKTGRPLRNGWRAEVSTSKLLRAKPDWVEAQYANEGDFLVFPKPRPEPPKTVLSLDLARLAGFYLADGSASLFNGHKGLQFSFHIDDVEKIDEVREVCKKLYNTEGSITWIEEKHEAHVVVYTKAGYEAMRTHVGTGSHTKRLSQGFMAQDETFLRELVRTYVLGDGSVTYRGGDAWWHRAHTTSRIWAHQLQSILARLGIFATVRLERKGGPGEILGRSVTRRDLYIVQWTEGRRMGEVRDAGSYFLVPIKSITTEDFDGFVHNLDVESPDSYLAGGFAVHNCSAPVYSSDSLHSAVVEIIVKDNARARYTTIQNWSSNVYNLVTKRAVAYENSVMEWVDANLGSKITMKYPAVILKGRGAKGEVLSVAYAGEGQHQDAGAKITHVAPDTQSTIISKSISKDGGRAGYRGLVRIDDGATNAKSNVRCDALILDEASRSDTYPYNEIEEETASVGHEATVSRVGDEQLFYLMSRGINEAEAMSLIVRGFIEPITKELPLEYAVELNRLVELQMEGSVG